MGFGDLCGIQSSVAEYETQNYAYSLDFTLWPPHHYFFSPRILVVIQDSEMRKSVVLAMPGATKKKPNKSLKNCSKRRYSWDGAGKEVESVH